MPPRRAKDAPALDDAPPVAARVVVLHGPETFLVEERTRRLAAALEAIHGELEVFRFDGSTEPARILDELRTWGLIQSHKLVIVDDADRLLAAKDDDDAAPAPRGARGRPREKTSREMFEAYAAEPMDSATLVLRAATWRPGKLDKLVAAIKCDTPPDGAAVQWCLERAPAAHGVRIAPRAAQRLVERLGPALGRLDTELAKLAALAGPGGTIEEKVVIEMVGLAREEKAWELQAPILRGDVPGAVRMLHELLEVSLQPEAVVTWAIVDVLKKLHAAACLVRARMPDGAIRSRLRLFGDAAPLVLDRARRLPPDRIAQLLRAAIEADRGTKSGLGRADRTLEVLTVRLADTMKRA